MDLTLQTKARHNTLTSKDLMRAGFPILRCCGGRTLHALAEAGWYVLQETTSIEVDCRGWTHCGPQCCGVCPVCGDRGNPRVMTLVAPFQPMSKSLARRMLHRVMARFH